MKNNFAISFITITLLTVAASEDCKAKCVRTDKCPQFGQLTQEQQDAWQAKHGCSAPDDNLRSKVFGFDTVAKGDFVCCSDSIWALTGNSAPAATVATTTSQQPAIAPRQADYNPDYGSPNYDGQNQNNGYNNYPNSETPYYDSPNNGNPGNNGWGANPYGNNGGYNNNAYNPNQGNPDYGYNTAPKHYFNVNNSPYVTQNPLYPTNNAGNNANINQGGQCPITSFPPTPETGCCGREATDSDRIIGHQPQPTQPPVQPTTVPNNNYGYNNWIPNTPATQSPSSYQMPWASWIPRLPNFGLGLNRVARSIGEEYQNVSIGVRIAGGRETDFTQFPWTVLLKVTFDYGNGKRAAFNCGGSLISSRYVLTAGHCVYDKGGKVVDLDVYLAEYDKRTFPLDCKIVPGEGKKCIKNILMKAEQVTLHPQYEDAQLHNDIALIRLKGNAPYTDYIRPICLPSIDIDTPQFFNLRLAVAGWGRNGRFRSDVKQSTVVNLIPQDKCKKSYPGLTKENICAAGYTGEDTCKGDSGGPLMTLYGGKYEVVGVVSGKRADSRCGSPVPSLYTNVYHYLDWIRNNIKY